MMHLSTHVFPKEHNLIPFMVVFSVKQSSPVVSLLEEGITYRHPEQHLEAIVWAANPSATEIMGVLQYHYGNRVIEFEVIEKYDEYDHEDPNIPKLDEYTRRAYENLSKLFTDMSGSHMSTLLNFAVLRIKRLTREEDVNKTILHTTLIEIAHDSLCDERARRKAAEALAECEPLPHE